MPRNAFTQGLQLITAPQTLTTFLVGGVAIGVLGDAVYQLLTNWLTTSNWAVWRIIIGSVLVLLVVIWVFGRIVSKMQPAPPLPGKKAPDKRRGLIVLVSNEPTARKAIEWHLDKLELCWLVCSEQSHPVAEKLRDELLKKGRNAELIFIHDVYDPVECRNEVNRIFELLPEGYSAADVILDFTGMTAVASVGSVLACLDEDRSIQYVPGVFDKELKVIQPRDPVEIVLDWGTVQISPGMMKEKDSGVMDR